jgi:hypothetical protein
MRPSTSLPRADGGGATFTVPASIPADCSVDVTPSLQSWLDATPDHSVISFPERACYRIERTLRFTRRRDVVVDGNGATLEAKTPGSGDRLGVRGRAHVLVAGSKNVVVRDLIVRGANPDAGANASAYQPRYEAQHGFSLIADDGVTLDHVQAYDVFGDFVYIGGPAGSPSRQVVIKGSRFARSGRQGISITNAADVDISGNAIGDVARSLVDLEPNLPAQEVRNIRIVDNETGPVRNFWLADKGVGIDIGDVTVSRNVMKAPSGGLVFVYGPKRGKRGPFVFSDNDFQVTGAVNDEGGTGAFVFVNARDVDISRNRVRVPATRRMPAVELRATSAVVIADNEFTGTVKPLEADGASTDVQVRP